MIDRRAWVGRHDVVRTRIDPRAPVQVGNGELAAHATHVHLSNALRNIRATDPEADTPPARVS